MTDQISSLPISRGTAPGAVTRAARQPLPPSAFPAGIDLHASSQRGSFAQAEGFSAIREAGLGAVRLPNTLDLIAALEAAREYAGLADAAVPGLGRLVSAVIEDETAKLSRYLDLRSL